MYLITGGRKTESSLYRVRYTAEMAKPEPKTSQQIARETFSRQQRELRRQLERFHVDQSTAAINAAWPSLAAADPVLRHAARIAIEHQPIARWRERALTETDPKTRLVALLALARSGEETAFPQILRQLNELAVQKLSAYDRLTLLRTYTICLEAVHVDDVLLAETQKRLTNWLQRASHSQAVAPEGAGGSIASTLSHLVAQSDASPVVPTIIQLLKQARTQQERIDYLFILREQPAHSWPADGRRAFFETLADLERSARGGDGMPGFLQKIRDEATATLSDSEREQLRPLLSPANKSGPERLTVDRDVVREWKLSDQDLILSGPPNSRDLHRGRRLFREVLCSHCHRRGTEGGVVGPDLSSVGNRFSRRDILASILDPSRVVAEQYRNVQVVTREGRVITGRPLTQGDYRSPSLRIATDPLDATKIVEISKSDIESHQPATLSPMPQGLLNTLDEAEILDLLAYLQSPPAD
jgi:putative heme-binding domain-containing protein